MATIYPQYTETTIAYLKPGDWVVTPSNQLVQVEAIHKGREIVNIRWSGGYGWLDYERDQKVRVL